MCTLIKQVRVFYIKLHMAWHTADGLILRLLGSLTYKLHGYYWSGLILPAGRALRYLETITHALCFLLHRAMAHSACREDRG